MSARRKSNSEHDAMVLDESVDPLDRAQAILCLAIDGRTEHEAAFGRLVDHPHPDVRARALQALLSWGLEPYLPKALHAVVHEPDSDARSILILGLRFYGDRAPQSHDSICRALYQVLKIDEECQAEAYEVLLALIDPENARSLDPLEFDPERDIDWDLIAPYAEPPSGLH